MAVPIKAATFPMTMVATMEMCCLPRTTRRPKAPMMAPTTIALMTVEIM